MNRLHVKKGDELVVIAGAERGKRGKIITIIFFFSSRRRHTRCLSDWSSDVCSSDLPLFFFFFSFYLASTSRYEWQQPSCPLLIFLFQKYYIRIVCNSK